MSSLFQEFVVKDMILKNRVVLPPMCMYCAGEDGKVTPWHVLHYGTRAVGQVGLIIVEATGVSPEGRISANDLGLWEDSQVHGMKEIVDAVHNNGGKVGIQLNHAGRKCTAAGMDVEAPSGIAFDEESVVPREMTEDDIAETVVEFVGAAERALEAGFDIIEIHGAHGYLLSEFLSPLCNKRKDSYGGPAENRVRFLGEVIAAVKEVWPQEKPIQVRVSAEDYGEGGNVAEDLAEMLNMIKDLGVDIVNVSTGGVISAAPKVSKGYQVPHAAKIKEETGLPVIAGGIITEAEEAEEIVQSEKADLVYLGRELLRNPYWTLDAAKKLNVDLPWPKQYERAKR